MPQSDIWPFTRSLAVDDENTSEMSSVLQKQLGDMEGEVKEIQMELAAIRRDRLDLYNRKQSRLEYNSNDVVVVDSLGAYDGDKTHCALTDVPKLREELIRAKNAADEERFQREKYEEKLKELERKVTSIVPIGTTIIESKEPRRLSDEDNSVLKSQLREMREEMEEMRITLTEKTEQLQEYRIKYLQAEQQAEELRRQLDSIENDNKQVSDQIQIEIQKMKMQFQEKLQELSPLPDLLKGAQIQLHEAKQLQRLAEDSAQQLSNELQRVKEKLVMAVNSLNQEKAESSRLSEENSIMKGNLQEKQKEVLESQKELEVWRCKVLRLEDKYSQQEQRMKEKAAECAQVLKDLDELRTESSRTLTRNKERTDSMRRYMQTQISELERQLIQSRAQCRGCQKERDEIRQKMQIQINNVQENFEMAEIRLRALQNQVSSLKSSFTVILADEDDSTEFNNIITS